MTDTEREVYIQQITVDYCYSDINYCLEKSIQTYYTLLDYLQRFDHE